MSSTLCCTPKITIYRQILSIRVGYYELGCCLNSIHSKLWIIALNFDLFRSIIGAMVGCRCGCYGRLKRSPTYRGIVLYQYSRRVKRKLVLVVSYSLSMASYTNMTLHHQKFHNKFRACVIISLSGITRSAPRFFMGRPAALDEATIKKRGAKGVCGSNGNGPSGQG